METPFTLPAGGPKQLNTFKNEMYMALIGKFGDPNEWPKYVKYLYFKSMDFIIRQKSLLAAIYAAGEIIKPYNSKKSKEEKHVNSILLMLVHLYQMKAAQDYGYNCTQDSHTPTSVMSSESFRNLFDDKNPSSVMNRFKRVTGVAWEDLGLILPTFNVSKPLQWLCEKAFSGFQYEMVEHRFYEVIFLRVHVPRTSVTHYYPLFKARSIEETTFHRHWDVTKWKAFFQKHLFPLPATFVSANIKKLPMPTKALTFHSPVKLVGKENHVKDKVVAKKRKKSVKSVVGVSVTNPYKKADGVKTFVGVSVTNPYCKKK